MHLRLFLFAVLLVFLLSLCRIDAKSVKFKATQESISQTANINTKRDAMSPLASDAGGIMQRLLNGYLGKHGKKDPIETPTSASPPPTSPIVDSDASNTNENADSPTDEQDPNSNVDEEGSHSNNTTADPNVTAFNEGIAAVRASFGALVEAVRNDDSIYGEIGRNITLSSQLLDQIQKKFDPKHIMLSLRDFEKLVDTVEGMSAAVFEQNDDARLGRLLQALAGSLHQLLLAFQRFVPTTSPTSTSLPNLSGVDSAINGGQEA